MPFPPEFPFDFLLDFPVGAIRVVVGFSLFNNRIFEMKKWSIFFGILMDLKLVVLCYFFVTFLKMNYKGIMYSFLIQNVTTTVCMLLVIVKFYKMRLSKVLERFESKENQ